MNSHKRLNIIFSILILASLLLGASGQVSAQQPAAQGGQGQGQANEKITQADRQAAADRAAAAGLVTEAVGTADMAMPGAAPRYFSHPNYANSPLPGNAVAEWNAIAQELLQPTPMPGMPMPMGGVSMSAAFVYLAYTQAAVYNALVAIEGGYTPYNSTLTASPDASRDAAVAAAAHDVLVNDFPLDSPEKAMLDSKYAASLAIIPDGQAKTDGIAVGAAAAAEIIALRTDDVLSGDGGYVVPPPDLAFGNLLWVWNLWIPGCAACSPSCGRMQMTCAPWLHPPSTTLAIWRT